MPTATTDEVATDVAEATTSKAPVATFRHRNISASVFANEGKNGGTFYSVTLERGFKDAEGNWQHSSSFLRDDVPVANRLLDQAWGYVLDQEAKRTNADT